MTKEDAIKVKIMVVEARSADTDCGKKNWPILIDRLASIIQLPKMSPINNLYSFLRIAVISTDNSGSEVPIAAI